MVNVVSRALYGKKRWKKSTSLLFTQHDTMVPIGISEFPQAIISTAVAFLTINNQLTPVALQSLVAGQNWFVGHEGSWHGEYLPAIYRCYPFCLAKSENNELVLCVDEESGLITDEQSGEGEFFFDAENNPSATVNAVVNELNKMEQDSAKARAICALLEKYELFEPWPIQLQGDTGSQNIEGLYRINESKLNTLPAEILMELRDRNALLVVYGQLFSMNNLSRLGKLAAARRKSNNKAGNTSPGLLSNGGTISFDNL